MEYTDKIKQQKLKNIINIAMTFAIIFASVMMLLAIITLVKNKNIIQNDPITYLMKEMGFTSCSCILEESGSQCACLDAEGKVWESTGHSQFVYNKGNMKSFRNFSIFPD